MIVTEVIYDVVHLSIGELNVVSGKSSRRLNTTSNKKTSGKTRNKRVINRPKMNRRRPMFKMRRNQVHLAT